MDYKEVLQEIAENSSGEDVGDILTMVHLIEPFVSKPKTIERFSYDFRLSTISENKGASSARIAGTLLCLLFAPVKPPDYQMQMKSIRGKFRRISTSPDAQANFRLGLELAARSTAFYNFGRAQKFLPRAMYKALDRREGLA